jgi:hypothetical protein
MCTALFSTSRRCENGCACATRDRPSPWALVAGHPCRLQPPLDDARTLALSQPALGSAPPSANRSASPHSLAAVQRRRPIERQRCRRRCSADCIFCLDRGWAAAVFRFFRSPWAATAARAKTRRPSTDCRSIIWVSFVC